MAHVSKEVHVHLVDAMLLLFLTETLQSVLLLAAYSDIELCDIYDDHKAEDYI